MDTPRCLYVALLLLFVAASSLPPCQAEVVENLVAMIPAKTLNGLVKWAYIKWDDDAPNATTAEFKEADLTDERISNKLGQWANFQVSGDTSFALTCKADPEQDSLICLVSTSSETRLSGFGGCCADSIMIKGKKDPYSQTFYLVDDIRAAMLADGYSEDDVGSAFPSHTLSVQREESGALSVVVNVQVRLFEIKWFIC